MKSTTKIHKKPHVTDTRTPPPPMTPEEEEEAFDHDEEEQAPPPSRAQKRTTRPVEKETGASSLDDHFDQAIDSGGGSADDVPTGNYEAVVTEIFRQPFDPAKGQSMRMKFRLCDPDLDAAEVTCWFKILDSDRQPAGFTIGKFKSTLAKLGYKPTAAEMADVIEEIEKEQPGVLLKISYKDVEGTTYQRVDVVSACDNDVVQEYKDKNAY